MSGWSAMTQATHIDLRDSGVTGDVGGWIAMTQAIIIGFYNTGVTDVCPRGPGAKQIGSSGIYVCGHASAIKKEKRLKHILLLNSTNESRCDTSVLAL